MVLRHAHVLVDVEGNCTGETDAALAVQPDQLSVQTHHRVSRGETEHAVRANEQLSHDFLRGRKVNLRRGVLDDNPHVEPLKV